MMCKFYLNKSCIKKITAQHSKTIEQNKLQMQEKFGCNDAKVFEKSC